MQGTPSPYPHPPQPGMAQPQGLPETFSQNPPGIDIGLWPLAWGWWGLIVLAVILLIALVLGIRVYRRNRLHLRMALQELQSLDSNDQQIRSHCNQILKRTFMSYYPVELIAKLHGDDWSQFLQRQLTNKKQMALTPLLDSLGDSFYGPQNDEQLPDSEFITASMTLLKHSLPPSKKQRREALIHGGSA